MMKNSHATQNNAEKERFGKRLRELRRQKNLTQKELGEIVGITSVHISRYESGTAQKPSAETIQRLADVLGVSSDYLLKGATDNAAKARLEDQELLQLVQELDRLSEKDKMVVKTLLEAFITKRKIQELTAE